MPRILTGAHTRWMCGGDLCAVLQIERLSFPDPWGPADFARCLRQRNVIGLVAVSGDRVVGYVLYELLRASLHVVNIAVDPAHRRGGIGTQLLDKVREDLKRGRSCLTADVHERSLAAQLFLRAAGFRCVAVERGLYDDGKSDGYRFSLSVRGEG